MIDLEQIYTKVAPMLRLCLKIFLKSNGFWTRNVNDLKHKDQLKNIQIYENKPINSMPLKNKILTNQITTSTTY